jgi:hypothetical protein
MPADFKMHVLVHFNDFYFLDARADYSRSEDYLLPRVATVLRRLRKHLGDGVTVCMQISGLTVTWDGDALDRVCISGNRPPSLGELALDATQYSVATLDYVASTSTHYCAYFADRPFADGGSYQQSFTAAIARLGS